MKKVDRLTVVTWVIKLGHVRVTPEPDDQWRVNEYFGAVFENAATLRGGLGV